MNNFLTSESIDLRRCYNSDISLDLLDSITLFSARRIASALLATAIPSVCPSVRHTPVLCQNDGT